MILYRPVANRLAFTKSVCKSHQTNSASSFSGCSRRVAVFYFILLMFHRECAKARRLGKQNVDEENPLESHSFR